MSIEHCAHGIEQVLYYESLQHLDLNNYNTGSLRMSCGCNSKTISNLDVARLYPMEPRPKWADKSTTSYDILDFKSNIKFVIFKV